MVVEEEVSGRAVRVPSRQGEEFSSREMNACLARDGSPAEPRHGERFVGQLREKTRKALLQLDASAGRDLLLFEPGG